MGTHYPKRVLSMLFHSIFASVQQARHISLWRVEVIEYLTRQHPKETETLVDSYFTRYLSYSKDAYRSSGNAMKRCVCGRVQSRSRQGREVHYFALINFFHASFSCFYRFTPAAVPFQHFFALPVRLLCIAIFDDKPTMQPETNCWPCTT